MRDDITPQKVIPPADAPPTTAQFPPDGALAYTDPPQLPHKKVSLGRRIGVGGVVAVALAIITALGGWYWYKTQLQAVSPGSTEQIKVTISPGADPGTIASTLKEHRLIRSTFAFELYVRNEKVSGSLQSGVYRLSKGDDVPTIVKSLTLGNTDTFTITFLPGNTLQKHRQTLIKSGYNADDVDAALSNEYDHPLLSTKPRSADLEGYIYGETYEFFSNVSVEEILSRTFDEYYKVVKAQNLAARYKKQGLSLYEGITLASIIQREVVEPKDMRQVAQVFFLRLKKDMQLGSDVTYQYAADKTGQARDVNLDSPYNTRRYAGLPPGPIASPGEEALIAVGAPEKGNYLYFLSGDDDKTYFGQTNEEHERNIVEHCQKKCQII